MTITAKATPGALLLTLSAIGDDYRPEEALEAEVR